MISTAPTPAAPWRGRLKAASRRKTADAPPAPLGTLCPAPKAPKAPFVYKPPPRLCKIHCVIAAIEGKKIYIYDTEPARVTAKALKLPMRGGMYYLLFAPDAPCDDKFGPRPIEQSIGKSVVIHAHAKPYVTKSKFAHSLGVEITGVSGIAKKIMILN
jgi:hypothetical protein